MKHKRGLILLCLGLFLVLLWAHPPRGLGRVESNVIRWVSQGEEDIFAYDLYRGDSAEGPFVRVNARSIAGGGTTDVPRRYQFEDDSLDPDKVYWYYVESVSLTGERKAITPVLASRPKPRRLF